MGRELKALTLIFSLIANAHPGIGANNTLEQKQFSRHPGENRGPGLDSVPHPIIGRDVPSLREGKRYGFRRNDIKLLTTDAEDFDFRDEHNRPVKGDREKIETLFLESAYKLLVLGLTIPKKLTTHLLEQTGWLQRIKLAARKTAHKTLELAAMLGKRLKSEKSPPGKISGKQKISQSQSRSGILASQLLFRGAPVPLRI